MPGSKAHETAPVLAAWAFALPGSRPAARIAGVKRYFTGTPCIRGHVLPRKTKDGTCPACLSAYNKKFHADRPRYRSERCHAWRRKQHNYPMPTRAAPSHCELCAGQPGKRGLFIDHDHDTGVFRGWLCQWCNSALGTLGDNIAGLEHALAYLKRAQQ